MFTLRYRVVVVFPGGAYDSVWDSVLPMTGNFPLFPVPVDVGCVAC